MRVPTYRLTIRVALAVTGLFLSRPAFSQTAPEISLDPSAVAPGSGIVMFIQGQDTNFGPTSSLVLDPGLTEITSVVRSPTEIHAQILVDEFVIGPLTVSVNSPLGGGGSESVSAPIMVDPNLSGTTSVFIDSPVAGEQVTGYYDLVTGFTDPGAFVVARYIDGGNVVSIDAGFADEFGDFSLGVMPGVSTTPPASGMSIGRMGPKSGGSSSPTVAVSSYVGSSIFTGGGIFGGPPGCTSTAIFGATSVVVTAPGPDCVPSPPIKVSNNKFNYR